MEVVQSVLAIVAFVRAGKYADAAVIAFRLAAQLLEQLTGPNVIGSAVIRKPDDESKDVDQLCDDLEAAVVPQGTDAAALPPVLIPILLLLARKLIERLLK